MKDKKIMIYRKYIVLLMVLFLVSCSNSESGKTGSSQGTQVESTYFKVPAFFEGRIVFESNDDGDFDIYVLDKKGVNKITNNTWDDEYPMWSPDGMGIVFQANPKSKKDYDIFTMNADGSGVYPVLNTTDWEGDADFCSQDGKNIVYVRSEEQIYYYSLETKVSKPMEPEFKNKSIVPVWSAVNNNIVFTRKRMLGWDVALYKSKTSEIQFLTDSGESCRARWSHKGDRLAFVSSRADGKGDIWMMNADGSNQTRITTDDDAYDYYPTWSPDDAFIAYTSATHKTKGNWSLWLIEIKTGKKWKIYDSPGQEKFPDWTK